MEVDRLEYLKKKISIHVEKAKKAKIKFETKNEEEYFEAMAMNMFQAINYALDLMKEIIKKRKLGLPFSYHECVDILYKNGIIDQETKFNLKKLIILRNKIAHEYGTVSDDNIMYLFPALKYLGKLSNLEL